jgi:hypothetical protein
VTHWAGINASGMKVRLARSHFGVGSRHPDRAGPAGPPLPPDGGGGAAAGGDDRRLQAECDLTTDRLLALLRDGQFTTGLEVVYGAAEQFGAERLGPS